MADNEEKQYYEWKSIYPQLQVLIDNIDVIRKEAASIPQWVPWPEELVDDTEKTVVRDWTVLILILILILILMLILILILIYIYTTANTNTNTNTIRSSRCCTPFQQTTSRKCLGW